MTRAKGFVFGVAVAVGLLVPGHQASAWFVADRGWGGGGLLARDALVGGGAVAGPGWGGWGSGWRGGCWRCGAEAGAVEGLGYGAPYYGAQPPMYAPPTTGWQPSPPGMGPPPPTTGPTRPMGPPAPPAPGPSPPSGVAGGPRPPGAQLATLPPGSRSMVINGGQYYQNGATWYRPYFGPTGVYYEVVPAP